MKNAQSTQSGAKRTLSGALFCSLLLTTSLLAGCQIAPSNAPKLLAPLDQLRLEWADVYQEREKGLMGRTSLPENAGMMFVFETPKTYCFWMKNTLIPLSVGFIDTQGRLVQIAHMQPRSLQHHCAKQPILYALEVNQGWFERNNVKVQTKVLQPSNQSR